MCNKYKKETKEKEKVGSPNSTIKETWTDVEQLIKKKKQRKWGDMLGIYALMSINRRIKRRL